MWKNITVKQSKTCSEKCRSQMHSIECYSKIMQEVMSQPTRDYIGSASSRMAYAARLPQVIFIQGHHSKYSHDPKASFN